MTIRKRLFDKLERSRVPDETKPAFKTMLAALLDARAGDSELNAPEPKSFNRLLEFYSQPYRRLWVIPSVAIDPEGIFVAAWGVPGDEWLVTFCPSGEVTWKYLKQQENGMIVRITGIYDDIEAETGPPILIPKR